MMKVLSFFKPRHILDWVLYLGIAPFAILCVYWAVFDTRLTVELDGHLVRSTVRQGETLELRYTVVWSKDCEITAHRFIIDSAGQRYTMDSESRFVRAGREEIPVDVPIPLAAAPGEASYRVQVLSECNPWQRMFSPVVTDLESRDFLILPGVPAARGLAPATIQCGGERPIFVQPYCRAKPGFRQASR